MNWLQEIATLKLPTLRAGAHISAEFGLCAMEMVAFMERLPHSDSPPCTCPVIASFVRNVNDRMTDADRQRLLAYLPRLVGTVSPEHRAVRAEYLVREVAHRMVAPLYAKRWPQHERAILSAQTMIELRDACRAARAAYAYAFAASDSAAYAAASAAYAAASASDSAAAYAYASAASDSAAAAASAAYATAYAYATAAAYAAAATDAKKRFADVCLSILDGVLQIGPSARAFSHSERVAELCELTHS